MFTTVFANFFSASAEPSPTRMCAKFLAHLSTGVPANDLQRHGVNVAPVLASVVLGHQAVVTDHVAVEAPHFAPLQRQRRRDAVLDVP